MNRDNISSGFVVHPSNSPASGYPSFPESRPAGYRGFVVASAALSNGCFDTCMRQGVGGSENDWLSSSSSERARSNIIVLVGSFRILYRPMKRDRGRHSRVLISVQITVHIELHNHASVSDRLGKS
jgi:hypothetical protein